jgi:16S rRNA (uracil1498-N3)-methyltransferase
VRTSAAHVFVADLDEPVLDDGDRHHLERVLRLRVGEVVSVSDGRGGVRPCTYVAGAVLEPAGEVEWAPAPVPSIGVGFALVKGEKPEWIVQKLTECGVDRIFPFVAERSVVRWDDAKAQRNLERLRAVAREAAMQSRRVRLPDVEPLGAFVDAVAGPGVALADPDGDGPDPAVTPVVLVGPEGGWSPTERAGAERFVRLGPTILRAETAAVAAGVLLSALRDRVVAPEARVPRS